jgi:hypothetical protein
MTRNHWGVFTLALMPLVAGCGGADEPDSNAKVERRSGSDDSGHATTQGIEGSGRAATQGIQGSGHALATQGIQGTGHAAQ